MSEDVDPVAACVGKVPVTVWMRHGGEAAWLLFSDRTRLWLTHKQECCESFGLEEIYGEPSDLIGHQLAMAERVTTRPEDAPEPPAEGKDSFTDTWVRFRSHGGDVTLRFRGSSNGHYSESCDAFLGPARLDEAEAVTLDAWLQANAER